MKANSAADTHRGGGHNRRSVEERMKGLGLDLGSDRHQKEDGKNSRINQVAQVHRHRDGIAPVSLSVVAAILMIQKIKVTSGTLIKASCVNVFILNPSE